MTGFDTDIIVAGRFEVPDLGDSYFQRSEVSNSDLSWLKEKMLSPSELKDYRDAYRIGNLIDAMITENHKVDYLKRTWTKESYTEEEFEMCKAMKRSFMKDEFCKQFHSLCRGQVVFINNVKLSFEDYIFELVMRCKFDLWADFSGYGADVKSTTATTQRQFVEAIRYFDYDRQRVTYMKISGAKQDMLIGISKKNHKVFKVPITIGSDLWKSGSEKLSDLGFKWWYLFDNV